MVSLVSLPGSLLPSTIVWLLSLLISLKALRPPRRNPLPIPLTAPRPPRHNPQAGTKGGTPSSDSLVSTSLLRLDTGYFLFTVCS